MNDNQRDTNLTLTDSFVECFVDATSTVLSQISGTALSTKVTAGAIDAAIAVRVEVQGCVTGRGIIAISSAMSKLFAEMLMGQGDVRPELNAETLEAAQELIQQICGVAADRLRARFGKLELNLTMGADATELRQLKYQVISAEREQDTLEFGLSIIELEPLETPTSAGETSAQKGGGLDPAAEPQPSRISADRNLDLLLDIELGVTLRFGTRSMALKDVVELSSGSVVELDRHVKDPVDLLIDGRVIARGEVVVIGGNYGLRILQVAGPNEKIACLS